MNRPATINRSAVVLRATDACCRWTGTCRDAGPVLKRQPAAGELNGQVKESRKLEKAVRSNLEGLGYGG